MITLADQPDALSESSQCSLLGVSPSCRATNVGIDMSKPSLQLIHCSNSIPAGAKRRHAKRSFRPEIIDGGVKSATSEHPWETALELFGVGVLVAWGNYLALLEASTTVLNGSNWTDPEKVGMNHRAE
jgi:hypothetical protein